MKLLLNLFCAAIYFLCGVMCDPRFFRLRIFSTAIFRAAYTGNVNMIKDLISKDIDVNARQRDGLTPLMAASLKGHSEVVKILIENGADVNAHDNNGIVPIMYAFLLFRKLNNVIETLIYNGAELNVVACGMTPLMYASMAGNHEMAELMILKGANVCAKNDEGITPLMLAVMRGFPRVVKLLIEHGTDVNECSHDSIPVIVMAQYKNNKEVLEILRASGAKGEITGCCLRR